MREGRIECAEEEEWDDIKASQKMPCNPNTRSRRFGGVTWTKDSLDCTRCHAPRH